jgi:hypothetical protein
VSIPFEINKTHAPRHIRPAKYTVDWGRGDRVGDFALLAA